MTIALGGLLGCILVSPVVVVRGVVLMRRGSRALDQGLLDRGYLFAAGGCILGMAASVVVRLVVAVAGVAE